MMHRAVLVTLWAGLAACALGCGEKVTPKRQAVPDGQARRASASDAAPVVPVAKSRLRLSPGCACLAVPPGTALANAETRKVLVERLDRLNKGLRSLMEKLGLAAKGEPPARLDKPAPLLALRQLQVCRLDCMLAQFPGATEHLWRYLRATGRYLDAAKQGVNRLGIEPARRPKGPKVRVLAKLFNAVARASNHAHGLELITSRPPPRPVALDESSFRVKVGRWRKALAADTENFGRAWLPLVRANKPLGPALERPTRLRVAIAHLGQRLRAHASGAQALECKKGKRCAGRQARWVQAREALGALDKALSVVARKLRASELAALSVAEGRKLSQSTAQSFDALQKAIRKLVW